MKRSVFACVLLLAVGRAAAGFPDLSSAIVEHDRVTIVVPVEVVGATEELLETWREGIDRTWNRGNQGGPFVICGRQVVFDVRFMPGPARQGTGHIIFVEPVGRGERYVSSVWHALGTSPTESARTGFWSANLRPTTAAHEFGHILGLMDEYREYDANGNGMRDPGEGSLPDVRRYPADAWFSLMANEHGVVLERHIREVLRLHGATDALDCTP